MARARLEGIEQRRAVLPTAAAAVTKLRRKNSLFFTFIFTASKEKSLFLENSNVKTSGGI